MKKKLVILLFLLVTILTACSVWEDEVVKSLGKYEDHVLYTYGQFQDYTDYGKYYYTDAKITDNDYFTKITDADILVINEHFDDYEGWIEAHKKNAPNHELVVNYDFDRSIVDLQDYIYIDSETNTDVLVNYDIYFFDTQTQVLYYFHSNI